MYHYQEVRGGIQLFKGNVPCGRVLQKVAFAFDKKVGLWHKHGSPVFVSEWLESLQETLKCGGAAGVGMANDMAMILLDSVEEINQCIEITGYVGEVYKRQQAANDRLVA